MKPYHILKDFKGSQTGLDYHEFTADTTVPLSDSLAAIAAQEGWAKPAVPQEAIKHLQSVVAPIVGLDHEVPEGDPAEALPLLPASNSSAETNPALTIDDSELENGPIPNITVTVQGLPHPVPEGKTDQVTEVLLNETPITALDRETKVEGPGETKVVEPAATKSLDEMDFKELKALAKTKNIGLFGMSQAKLLVALKAVA